MAKDLKAGDKVKWESSGGEAKGKVVRKLTGRSKIKGHQVAASSDDPQYLVESEKSGGRAAHKPEALKKI